MRNHVNGNRYKLLCVMRSHFSVVVFSFPFLSFFLQLLIFCSLMREHEDRERERESCASTSDVIKARCPQGN